MCSSSTSGSSTAAAFTVACTVHHATPWAAATTAVGSRVGLDIYAWLTYRMSYLQRPTTVPWPSLRAQFGSDLADTKQGRGQFRRDFERHLREVVLVYR